MMIKVGPESPGCGKAATTSMPIRNSGSQESLKSVREFQTAFFAREQILTGIQGDQR